MEAGQCINCIEMHVCVYWTKKEVIYCSLFKKADMKTRERNEALIRHKNSQTKKGET